MGKVNTSTMEAQRVFRNPRPWAVVDTATNLVVEIDGHKLFPTKRDANLALVGLMDGTAKRTA